MYSIQVDGLPNAIRQALRERRESISTCNESVINQQQQLNTQPPSPCNFGFITQDNSRCSSACETRARELTYRSYFVKIVSKTNFQTKLVL